MKKTLFVFLLSITMVSCGVSKKEHEESVTRYEEELEAAQVKNQELEEEIQVQSKEIKTMKKKVVTMKEEHTNELEQLSTTIPSGVYYRIQIGAIKNPASDAELGQFLIKEGEYYKWRIGYFKTLEEVELAKKDLKKLGAKRFWVVPMKDGEIITYQQAKLESEISENGF
ncbi:MAG: SPOR domain-containing protein [Bacteroidota bacterium]